MIVDITYFALFVFILFEQFYYCSLALCNPIDSTSAIKLKLFVSIYFKQITYAFSVTKSPKKIDNTVYFCLYFNYLVTSDLILALEQQLLTHSLNYFEILSRLFTFRSLSHFDSFIQTLINTKSFHQ